MIGAPGIATGDPSAAAPLSPYAVTFQQGSWELESLHSSITSAFAERLALLPTGQPPNPVPIRFGAPQVLDPADAPPPTYGLPATATLAERQLYDVAVQGDDGQWTVVAPHAIYFRSSWHDFGIAHITDTHLARRIDSFRARLEQLGRSQAAQTMYNWNDRFRGFIRYANYLHSIDVLDVILVTGDFIDYIFEDDDDHNGGGNALFARELILGWRPSSTFEDVEELRVPIFIVAGNHDYRKNPYLLLFDVDLGPGDTPDVKNFSGYNIDWLNARVLSRGDTIPETQERSVENAAKMVEVDTENRPFRTHLVVPGPYVVELGPHRVAMIDSSWDVGVVDDPVQYVLTILGLTSEDERTFVGGSPNCEGVSDHELKMVAETMQEASQDALVIVALHAPLFNPRGSRYPYFLRETQRPALVGYVERYLSLHYPAPIRGAFPVRKHHSSWFAAEGQAEPTYVKRDDDDDLFEDGVSRGKAHELLRLVAGGGAPRAADVVLQGHTHRFNEFRMGWVDDELALFMDFYTQNPMFYYPTRFPLERSNEDVESDVTYVHVVDSAPADGKPTPLPYDAKHRYIVEVPPYPRPLATAPDARGWWTEHRPLVLQTAALGPLENSQVTFSGFRVLSVKGDVIDKIHFIPTQRLHENGYRLSWEEAIKQEPPQRYGGNWRQWLRVSEGQTRPGESVTAVALGGQPGRVGLFLADSAGGVYTTAGSPDTGWGPWANVSQGQTTPGGSVTAVALEGQPGRVGLFLADAGGGVYTTAGSPDTGWGPWASVSQGQTTPGATVTALPLGDQSGRVALFLADPAGGVYTTAGSPDGGWGPWANVSDGQTTPGGSVTAVPLGGQPGRVAVFVADAGGGVYTTAGSPDSGFGPWASVSQGHTAPGGSVTAVPLADHRVALFVADAGGGVYTTAGSPDSGFGPWANVAEGQTTHGGLVAAVALGGQPGRVAVFVADTAGGVYTTAGSPDSGFGPWANVSEGHTTPGGSVTAVPLGDRPGRVALFLADTAGGVYATAGSAT